MGVGGSDKDKGSGKGSEDHPSLTRTSASGAPPSTLPTKPTSTKPTLPLSCVAACSGQDLCVLRDNAQKWSKLDPKVAVDGVKCFACSVLQGLMFVLFERSEVDAHAHCLSVVHLPFLTLLKHLFSPTFTPSPPTLPLSPTLSTHPLSPTLSPTLSTHPLSPTLSTLSLLTSGMLGIFCMNSYECTLVGYLPADSVETRRAACMVLSEVLPREPQVPPPPTPPSPPPPPPTHNHPHLYPHLHPTTLTTTYTPTQQPPPDNPHVTILTLPPIILSTQLILH